MKKHLLTPLLLISLNTLCQNGKDRTIWFKPDKIIEHLVLSDSDIKNKEYFLSISGIDYNASTNKWFLVSDDNGAFFTFNNTVDKDDNPTYYAKYNTILNETESVRYDQKRNRFYFTIEYDFHSFLIYLDSGKISTKDTVLIHQFTFDQAFKNRGFEGLALSDDGKKLYLSVESGTENKEPMTNHLEIIEFLIDDRKITKGQSYYYPFKRDACITNGASPDGLYGNGVSEILYLSENKLLVLERCYDRVTKGNVILYEATLSPDNPKEVKRSEIFNFKDAGKNFIPQNIEGMTWGPPTTEGLRTLFLIADSNGTKLKTQFIKLIETKNP